MKLRRSSLPRTVVFTVLAGIAASGGLALALAEPPLSEQSAQYIENHWALLIAVVGLVLVLVCGVSALTYGMRHEGGRDVLRSFLNLIR